MEDKDLFTQYSEVQKRPIFVVITQSLIEHVDATDLAIIDHSGGSLMLGP